MQTDALAIFWEGNNSVVFSEMIEIMLFIQVEDKTWLGVVIDHTTETRCTGLYTSENKTPRCGCILPQFILQMAVPSDELRTRSTDLSAGVMNRAHSMHTFLLAN